MIFTPVSRNGATQFRSCRKLKVMRSLSASSCRKKSAYVWSWRAPTTRGSFAGNRSKRCRSRHSGCWNGHGRHCGQVRTPQRPLKRGLAALNSLPSSVVASPETRRCGPELGLLALNRLRSASRDQQLGGSVSGPLDRYYRTWLA
jgi:hypothetical protein